MVVSELQTRPVGEAMWAKEAGLLGRLFTWLVEGGYREQVLVRSGAGGRSPLVRTVRRGMDIRHLTLEQ
ncbi:hypothetical protein BOQ63_000095 (plasmid) [Streptomyces viridifaciens]|nr:hypothetical protein BOQ63_000095 [Streptomyces viridifaciens]